MDGIHDLGGMHGFGPVLIEEENYSFKHDWQRRSFGLAQSLAGTVPFCADKHRYKIELIPAADYLRMDYWEKWAVATAALVAEAGLANKSELATGNKEFNVDVQAHAPVSGIDLVDALKQGDDYKFPDASQEAKFQVGDQVRVRTDAPSWHTRVPRYVRGKIGTVVDLNGVFQFADSVAKGEGQNPQHCYLVSFDSGALWGGAAEVSDDTVLVDLAEGYLDAI